MNNNYGIFFTRGTTVIRLPINPEKLPVARAAGNSDYNVLGIGQIMVPRTPELRVVTISSFFPAKADAPYVLTTGRFEAPEFYINFFESAMRDKVPIVYTPVRYYETGEAFMTSDAGFKVLVTKFDTEERGGETGDFYYELEVTEYRDYSPSTLAVQSAATSTTAAKVTAEATRDVPVGQLFVGVEAIANGSAFMNDNGGLPGTPLSGRRVWVQRISDETKLSPVYVTDENGIGIGWMAKSALQAVSQK